MHDYGEDPPGERVGALAVAGGVIVLGLCCAGPLVILALASVGIGALLGGLGGTLAVSAAVISVLILRRTRRARRVPISDEDRSARALA